jgi:hypothetical protein
VNIEVLRPCAPVWRQLYLWLMPAVLFVLGSTVALVGLPAENSTAESRQVREAQSADQQRETLPSSSAPQGCTGSWSVVSSPNPSPNSNVLKAISVVSPGDIWAVGSFANGNIANTLTEHWDGTQWSVVTSPNIGPSRNLLVSVAAYSSNDVWAVGYYRESSTSPYKTLTEHWNGTQWSIVPSPNYSIASYDNYLLSVAVRAPNDVWTVGYYQSPPTVSTRYEVLTAHWDGTQWSYVPGATVAGADGSRLYGVAIAGPNDVWAVGWFGWTGGYTLIEHWNGTQWSIVSSPNPGRDNYLSGLTAVSPTDIWAVGHTEDTTYNTLILHWNGTEWSWVASPNTADRYNYLYSVSAHSSNDVWAVGNSGYPQGSTLTEHWDGSTWSMVPGATISMTENALLGVAAVAADNLWGVGYYSGGNIGQTLVERYSVQCGTASPTVLLPLTPTGTVQPSATRTATNTATQATTTATATGTANNTTTATETATAILTGTATPTSTGTPPTLDLRASWYAYSPSQCSTFRFVLSVFVDPQGATVPITTTMNFNGMDFVVPPFTGYYTVECSTGPCTPGHVIYSLVADSQNDVQETDEENNSDTHWHFFGLPCTPTATVTSTSVPTATSTACTIVFSDVPVESSFHSYIRCLVCRGIISGYSDGTFKPDNDITRSQIAKIVSNAAVFDEDPGPQIYQDVPADNTFYQWINRLSLRGHMGGYPCGTVAAEPCIGPDNRPYFRPFSNATRGQLAKVVANAAGLGGTPTGQFFTDVAQDHPFYTWIMRLAEAGVMGGYDCGGLGEPCDSENRPYFRPLNNVTRGQASKIVANTFFPGCQTPSR